MDGSKENSPIKEILEKLIEVSREGSFNQDLVKNLDNMVGVNVVNVGVSHNFPLPTIALKFSDDTELAQADYWRLVIGNGEFVSSFDYGQQYGLDEAIDAVKEIEAILIGKTVKKAGVLLETGDLFFEFQGGIKLQVFGFTGYEVWHIEFSDGTGQYSNYAKNPCDVSYSFHEAERE